ncbi:MAG: redoxin domain-containing protein [Fibromonadaceae bacterium]|nr:redoxin domain-containing protein [Fibromonadaceae bacterium]
MGAAMRRLTLSFIVLSAVFAFAKPSEELPLPQALQAKELPAFGFDAKDGGGTYNAVVNNAGLKELVRQKKSQRVIFSFFATWCVPCQEGLKLLSINSEELKKRGILIVLVNVAEKDLESYSPGKIEEWLKQKQYINKDWQLVFDMFSNSLSDFGLSKNNSDMPLPRTLITDANLRPLKLIGYEGDDFPQTLWSN